MDDDRSHLDRHFHSVSSRTGQQFIADWLDVARFALRRLSRDADALGGDPELLELIEHLCKMPGGQPRGEEYVVGDAEFIYWLSTDRLGNTPWNLKRTPRIPHLLRRQAATACSQSSVPSNKTTGVTGTGLCCSGSIHPQPDERALETFCGT